MIWDGRLGATLLAGLRLPGGAAPWTPAAAGGGTRSAPGPGAPRPSRNLTPTGTVDMSDSPTDTVSRRDAVINIRLTEAEKCKVTEGATAAGLTVSAYGRRRLLGRVVIADTDLATRRELRRLGGLLKLVHNESDGAYSPETVQAIRELREAVERVGRRT